MTPLILKKWASLFYPQKTLVDVFDALPGRTGTTQLKTYGEFLAHMQ